MVRPEISDAARPRRARPLATPQLGNTQDVALRAWLKEQGLTTDASGGGDVSILPQENADTLTAFKAGDIDGAWVPEPWATRLIQEGGGKVLVDERDLWPDGQYVTTHLIVRTKFLDEHPDVVQSHPARAIWPRSTSSTPTPTRRRRSPTTTSRPSPRSACPTR